MPYFTFVSADATPANVPVQFEANNGSAFTILTALAVHYSGDRIAIHAGVPATSYDGVADSRSCHAFIARVTEGGTASKGT